MVAGRVGRRKVERRIEELEVVGRVEGKRWEGGSGVRSDLEERDTGGMGGEEREEERRSLGRRYDRKKRNQVGSVASTTTAEILLGEEAFARSGREAIGVEEEEGRIRDDEEAAEDVGSLDEVEYEGREEKERGIENLVRVRVHSCTEDEEEGAVADGREEEEEGTSAEEGGRVSREKVWSGEVAEGGRKKVEEVVVVEPGVEAATVDELWRRELEGEEERRRPAS